MENISSLELWLYNLSSFQCVLLIIAVLYIVILIASNCYYLITYSNKIPWLSYWKCNIEETQDFILYYEMNPFGKILFTILLIIPRLIILTPIILIYMVLAFIWNILSYMIYKS